MVKILVIGNGFDLAHGLHTQYKDFLDFIKSYKDTAFDNQKIALSEFPISECDNEDIVKEKRKLVFERTIELNSVSYPKIPKEYLQFLFNNSMQNTLIKYKSLLAQCCYYEWINHVTPLNWSRKRSNLGF